MCTHLVKMEKFRVSLLLAILYFSCYGKQNFKILSCIYYSMYSVNILQVNTFQKVLSTILSKNFSTQQYCPSAAWCWFMYFSHDQECFASCSQCISARGGRNWVVCIHPLCLAVPSVKCLSWLKPNTEIDVKFGTAM